MLDLFIKLALAAAGTYAVADVASRVMTSKGLHTHLFEWWNSMRDRIVNWCNQNASLEITRVVGYVTQRIDDLAVSLKRRITFRAKAETARGTVNITEEVVSADELARLFPELADSQTVVL